jgi:hypothetical protein
MSHQRFSIIPGAMPYGSFLQVRIATPDPLQWLAGARDALTFLLEGFRESDAPEGDQVRAYGVRLLSWLYPLPSQFAAGVKPLDWTPPNTEEGGVFFTFDGLAIRFMETTAFEELDAIARALLTLAWFNGYDLEEKTRRQFFDLFTGLLPTTGEVAVLFAEGGADFFGLGKHERQFALDAATIHANRSDLLRRTLDTPAERLNARWFKGLARLAANDLINEAAQNWLLEWVATGADVPEVAAT